MQTICPYTKQTFIPKRSNQKFSNSLARIAYHNSNAKKDRRTKLPIINIIKKNYKILLSNLKSSNDVIRSKDFLLGAEFDFNQITSFQVKDGINTALIFDFRMY